MSIIMKVVHIVVGELLCAAVWVWSLCTVGVVHGLDAHAVCRLACALDWLRFGEGYIP